nr:reverse transcriptase domain-containing protein [Tanacetum cinerariifolium]
MRTRSSSNLPVVSPSNPSTSNPKRRDCRRSKQPFILKESPIDTMADQHTMAELLRAPTEGYAEAIVVPSILAEQFKIKYSLINMMTSDQFFRLEKDNPHDHIRCRPRFLNAAAGANLLERHTQDVLTIIENKSKYQKMLKALLSNKEKLQELANAPLNENCSAVILKKLPKKLGDPRKFLIPCGFSELKCKALADLGASINLMPLSVWKKLGLPELISTRMTLKLANRAICTPAGIARVVFVPVGKFTFPADFVIVDYESDLRVPLILGRHFLRTAHALIDVHGEEMILHDGDERLTLNMRHNTSSYSKQPQKESINLIDVFNDSSEDFLEDLFSNQPSGNPTFSSHPELTSPEVKDDIFDLEGGNVPPEKLLDLDSIKDLHPPLHVNPLSGSTTYSSSPNLLF